LAPNPALTVTQAHPNGGAVVPATAKSDPPPKADPTEPEIPFPFSVPAYLVGGIVKGLGSVPVTVFGSAK
jgi:hypothetical protein